MRIHYLRLRISLWNQFSPTLDQKNWCHSYYENWSQIAGASTNTQAARIDFGLPKPLEAISQCTNDQFWRLAQGEINSRMQYQFQRNKLRTCTQWPQFPQPVHFQLVKYLMSIVHVCENWACCKNWFHHASCDIHSNVHIYGVDDLCTEKLLPVACAEQNQFSQVAPITTFGLRKPRELISHKLCYSISKTFRIDDLRTAKSIIIMCNLRELMLPRASHWKQFLSAKIINYGSCNLMPQLVRC